MDRQLSLNQEEVDLIIEALWNYKFEVNKSSAKFHFRYLEGSDKIFKEKHELIIELLKKIDYGNV